MSEESDHRIPNQLSSPIVVRGRGSGLQIANRFERIHVESDLEQLELDDQLAESSRKIQTEYFVDESGSVVSEKARTAVLMSILISALIPIAVAFTVVVTATRGRRMNTLG